MKTKIVTVFCFATLLVVTVGCDFNPNEKNKQQSVNDLIVTDEVFDSPMDSLEYIVKNVKLPASELVRICELLSWDLMYHDVEKSVYYGKLGLDLSKNHKNDSIIALLNIDLGMAYTFKQIYDTAKIYFDESLLYALKANDENLEAFLYNAYAKLYSEQGSDMLAVDYFEKAMRLTEKTGDNRFLATILSNIGKIYYRADNDEQAEKYLLNAIDMYTTKVNEPSDEDLSSMYSMLSMIRFIQKRYEEALESAQKGLTHAQLANSKYHEAQVLVNQADIYSEYKQDYVKAMEMANRGVELADELGNNRLKASSLQALAHAYFLAGDYVQSTKYILQAINLPDPDDLTKRKNAMKLYISSLIMSKQTDEAFAAFKTYDSLLVVINNQEIQYAISDLEIRYETEKKELKITSLEEEKRLMLWLGLAGGTVLLLALATLSFLWRWAVQKKRTVEQQKRLAEQQIKQLEQEKQLVATQSVLDGETRERARLARDLHDGLGSMLTGVKLSLIELKQGAVLEYADVERFDKALGLLDSSVQEMRRVAHHLMPDSLSRFGLKPAVSDFCNNLPLVTFAYYGDESRLDPNMEVMIYRSIYELVNNALKHASANQIMVQIIQEPNRIAFAVQDDGCGFNPSAVTEGMGLQNIRTRVASYNGMFDIDSKAGEGTEVNGELRIEDRP